MLKRGATVFDDFDIERWQLDEAVRSCTLAARGLWWEMLLIMRKNKRRPGFLTSASCSPLSPVALANLVGASEEEVSRLLRELEGNGVFSREASTQIIFNRGMVRDLRAKAKLEHERELAAKRQARFKERHYIKTVSNAQSNDPSLSLSPEEELNTLVPEGERVGEGSGEGTESVSNAPDLPLGLHDHPAVAAYFRAYRLIPPIFNQDRIVMEVGDSPESLRLWSDVLDYWRLNDYRPGSVGKMIERFKGYKFEPELKRNGNGSIKTSYSQRQSSAIDAALTSVGLGSPAGNNPDAPRVDRSLPAASPGGARTGRNHR